MRILIAFDKFKDALTARNACEIASETLRSRDPGLEIDLCPLTDGGEGFAEILTSSVGGTFHEHVVPGPRGGLISARVGLVRWGAVSHLARARLRLDPTPAESALLAIVDVASASGLELLPVAQRNPWLTSTLGTGELIRFAIEHGAAAILLGVGGSATNDLGLGALKALGIECMTEFNSMENPAPVEWKRIRRLDTSRLLKLPPLRIACDVDNLLLGAQGATASFGPQKGLPRDQVPLLENEVARMAAMLTRQFNKSENLTDVPGSGAAGGIPFGFMAAADAELISGAALVSEWLDLAARIQKADLVLTGEGRFDAGSLRGKGPGAIAQLATNLGKRVHVFAGQVVLSEPLPYPTSTISPIDMPLAEALKRARELLAKSIASQFDDV